MEGNNKNLLANIKIGKNISEEDRMLIEVKIWNFLGNYINRYTMGDSTSIPIEIAEELLNSICFSLDLELRSINNANEILIEKDIEHLLKASWRKIESLIDYGKKLLEEVKNSSPNIENISYNDTVDEIEASFNKYDYRFFAHKINCSIDYQLASPISEKLQGIEYINEYLKVLLIENQFCVSFNKDNIIYILKSYCQDYKGLLINIFEPVLTNAIGLEILGDNVLMLGISELQRKELLNLFRNLSKAEGLEKLRNSARTLCDIIGINDNEKIQYIQNAAANLYPRIEMALSTGNIDNVFLSFCYEEKPDVSEFIDNATMDDEKLRDLIDEIRCCRFISDKLAIVKEEVHSLSDLVEVLSQCFWEDETQELFKILSEDEINVIKHYLYNKGEEYSSHTEWEVKFTEYIGKS